VSAPPEPALRPEYGPALPDVLRLRLGVPRRWTYALGALVAAALLAGGIAVWLAGDEHYVHEGDPVFNLRYAGGAIERVDGGPGVLLRLVGRRGDLFLQSMEVRRLRLPAYRGAVSGMLPIHTDRHVATKVAPRFEGFVALEEGKARINTAPGYQIGFEARDGERKLYGREVLLVPDEPGARDGVAITIVQTNSAGAHSVEDAGAVGGIKKPYRSFRFGTATDNS
jgi:hypothetical protein